MFIKNTGTSVTHLDRFKQWFWFKTPLRRLALYLRDKRFSKINEDRWLRLILFSKTNLAYYDSFNFYMDEHMANWIVENFMTERDLAHLFKRRYPFANIIAGDLLDGMWLKIYAAEYLGLPEDWEIKKIQEKQNKIYMIEHIEDTKNRIIH